MWSSSHNVPHCQPKKEKEKQCVWDVRSLRSTRCVSIVLQPKHQQAAHIYEYAHILFPRWHMHWKLRRRHIKFHQTNKTRPTPTYCLLAELVGVHTISVRLCVCPLPRWQAIGWMNGRQLLQVRWRYRNNSADHSDRCPQNLRPVLMEARALFWGQQLDLSHCPLCPGTVTLTRPGVTDACCFFWVFFTLLPWRKHTEDTISLEVNSGQSDDPAIPHYFCSLSKVIS